MKIEVQDEVLLTNDQGAKIDAKTRGHWCSSNATCMCGEVLMVAASIFNPRHEKGNPEMRCSDHGVHAFMFKDLIIGNQPEQEMNWATK